ncbi:MAG: hypothetical protein ACLSII_13910, partial [Ruminococcus sp.]
MAGAGIMLLGTTLIP